VVDGALEIKQGIACIGATHRRVSGRTPALDYRSSASVDPCEGIEWISELRNLLL
jgi:hypothetical protein